MTDTQSSFDIETLVSRFRAAATSDNPRAEIKALMEDAVKDPVRVQNNMPEYAEDDVILFEDDTVSIWHCRFMPGYTVPAHDHQMTATIGIYQGTERNDFYLTDHDGNIQKTREHEVSAGDVLQIGPNGIHAVGCASERPCCGIHVYLGKLTTVERSLFDTTNGDVLKFTDDNYHRLTRVD